MRRLWSGIRLSRVDAGLLTFGMALLVVAAVGPQLSVSGAQIGPGASWWQRAIVGAAGMAAVAWALLASYLPGLRTGKGFLGAPPGVPARLINRQDHVGLIVEAVRRPMRAVAVVGIGGTGKSTLAAHACSERRVRRNFRDGVTWLVAGPGRDPVQLLADLARRLGDIDTGFTTTGQGRDRLAAALRGKQMLIVTDNVLGA